MKNLKDAIETLVLKGQVCVHDPSPGGKALITAKSVCINGPDLQLNLPCHIPATKAVDCVELVKELVGAVVDCTLAFQIGSRKSQSKRMKALVAERQAATDLYKLVVGVEPNEREVDQMLDE
jgi:hypothetical protein